MSIFIATLVAARDPDAFGLIVHGSALFVAAGGATYLTWYLLWHPNPNPNPNPKPNSNPNPNPNPKPEPHRTQGELEALKEVRQVRVRVASGAMVIVDEVTK